MHEDPRVVPQVLKHADYIAMNEARNCIKRMRCYKAWRRWVPTGEADINPHMWNPKQVQFVATLAVKQIMKGGRIGAGLRASDHRRLGPNRFATANLVIDPDTKAKVIVVNIHLMARSQTVAKWRYAVRMVKSLVALRAFLADLVKAHPGIPVVLGGDTNLVKAPTIGLGFKRVNTPADDGRKHYTRVWYLGKVSVTKPRKYRNYSDHDQIVVNVEPHAA